MKNENTEPCLEFDKPARARFPVCCRISIPRLGLTSSWLATKSACFEMIDFFRKTDHLFDSEVLPLREKVYASCLPYQNAELDAVMENLNQSMISLIQLSAKVSDYDRGITKGDQWNSSSADDE